MKKILSIALAVLFVFSVMAANAAITSPTTEIVAENSAAEAGFVFAVNDDEEAIAAANEELAKAAEDVDAYFGEATEAAKAITGNDELEICEFAPFSVSGYTEEMGDIDVTLTTSTAFEDGQKVAVLVNVDGEWAALEGTGNADSGVDFTLDAETAKALSEAGETLVAIAL